MTSASTKPGQTDLTAGGLKAEAAGSASAAPETPASGISGAGVASVSNGAGKGSGKGKKTRERAARIWSVLWRGLAVLLLVLLLFLAGALLALRSESVQAWLKDEINATLAASAAESGLHIRLTKLSGSLPFTAEVGLELADAQGLWLEAPQNIFVWDWAALPGSLRIAELTSREPRLLRLPDLPPSPPAPPSAPMTEKALRTILGQTIRTLNSLPGWLPEVQLDRLAVVNAQLPEFLLGGVVSADAAKSADKNDAADNEGMDNEGAGQTDTPDNENINSKAKNPGAPSEAPGDKDVANSSASASSTPPADSYFLANFDATLKAGSAGGNLNAVLAASGLNNAPLQLPGAQSGGLETRLEVTFVPRRSESDTPSHVTLAINSTLETKVLPADPAGQTASQALPSDALLQTSGAKGEDSADPTPPAQTTGATANATETRTPEKFAPAKTPPGPLATLIGEGARLILIFECQMTTLENPASADSPEALASNARIGLSGFALEAGPLSLKGHAIWQDHPVPPATDSAHPAPASHTTLQPTAEHDSWLSGPVFVDVKINLAASKNVSTTAGQNATSEESANPLDMLAAPATAILTARGPLAAPDLNLRVECADLRMGAHKLEQAVVNLGATPLNWDEVLLVVEDHENNFAPANSAPAASNTARTEPSSAAQNKDAAPQKDAPAKNPQLTAQLDVSARWDNQPLNFESQIFAGRDDENILQAGLRKLRLNALGVEAAGQLAASLPPGSMPACNGKLDVRVVNWAALSTLVPGARLDGEAALSLELKTERVAAVATEDGAAGQKNQNSQNTSVSATQANLENTPATPALSSAEAAASADKAAATPAQRYSQKAELRWNVPRLSYSAGSGAPLTLQGLAGEVTLKDIFAAGNLAARLDLASVRQGDLNLGAKVRASGPLNGPLEASVETSGSVAAHVNARWQPGLVQVQRLEAHLSGRDLGLKATPGATLRYGDSGLDLAGLDIRLVPGGRLRAQATLGQDKLDVRLDLEELALTPWKKLVPALPEGTVEARARLTGSPSRPGGDFRLGVRQLRIPGSPLKPLNLGLAGRIEASGGSSGSLVARLEVDKESVQALGGSEARLEVRLPLLFGKDGLPQPNMQGPLRGQVRWTGAAGPLWSLLPIADQRFAGNVAVAVDLGGTLTAPSAKGSVVIDKGKYENLLQGVLLTNINLRLNLEEGRGGNSGKKQGGLPG
ncbi:MAG: hypothetical protein QM579_02785, partial [Desulfovibrio sp.]|uniref:hypothetical protein n=1 Tax=Desulfovibrio sp. TaxID=885 RepID=UPI0039E317D4